MYIRYPNGVETPGKVLEVRHAELLVFTYGYASGNPIPDEKLHRHRDSLNFLSFSHTCSCFN